MIRYLANHLLDPLNHLIIALLLGAIFVWYKKTWGKYLLWYAAILFFLFSVSPLPLWLASRLEARYPVFSRERLAVVDSTEIHIIVLGGGHTVNPDLPPNNQLSPNALARIVEGVRIHRKLPGSKLIGSGFSSSGQVSQAEVLMNTALALGVDAADTLQIPTPFNTEAESYAYVARFGCERPLILVTDAIHMRRAVYWFEKVGCDPLPAPTNHQFKSKLKSAVFSFKPSVRKMEIMDKWLHEWVGLGYAKWKI